MEGRAMLMEDPMKGVMKEVKVATTRAARLIPKSLMMGFYTISCKNRNSMEFHGALTEAHPFVKAPTSVPHDMLRVVKVLSHKIRE
jgi:hypothetical protein